MIKFFYYFSLSCLYILLSSKLYAQTPAVLNIENNLNGPSYPATLALKMEDI